MIPDGEYTAVVDEVEESLARLELGGDGEWYDLVVGTEELPDEARQADAVLTVTVTDDTLVDAVYRPDETAQRREKAQDRFDRLSRRPPGSDDDADGASDG
jgi:predicted AlkP superfamily phosphohydrolase/phosphomutase